MDNKSYAEEQNNNLIVAKFGGSSLANAEQFKKVANIINSDKSRRYIVVSAPGKRYPDDTKVTDMLYELSSLPEKDRHYMISLIKNRFFDICNGLELDIDIDRCLEPLYTERSVDGIVSLGEYMSAVILSSYLRLELTDPKRVIFFNYDGSLDHEKTDDHLKRRLKENHGSVIPGFYGALPNGETKTFSRGGSDITGALVAKAVNARIYENWTDVDGLLMTDPKIVSSPEVIEKISYRDMEMLSSMGAEVLHRHSVYPVESGGIPINIKNTNRPHIKGSLVGSFTDTPKISGISGKKGYALAVMRKKEADIPSGGIVSEALYVFEGLSIPVIHVFSGPEEITLAVCSSCLKNKKRELISRLMLKDISSAVILDNIALLAVVGKGIDELNIDIHSPKASPRFLFANSSPSSDSIILATTEDDSFEAVRYLYEKVKRSMTE